MSVLKRLAVMIVVLSVLPWACTRLSRDSSGEGTLLIEDLAQTDSIPEDWGKLVSVTISPDFPRRSQLWFQDDKGTIHLAFFELQERRLAPKSVVLRRR